MHRRTVSIMLSLSTLGTGLATAESLDRPREQFADPPREFASGPLWVWNDDLTEEQIVATLHDLAAQKVKQAFVHPRPGLMTTYLSDDWFRLWKKSLETAEELDMNIWTYDENSYPSGFAGGYVPEAMPESRGQGLRMESGAAPPAWSDDILDVYDTAGGACVRVTDQVKNGASLPEGAYTTVRIELAKESPWYGGWWYVDLLRPGVTEKFLEITMGAYERELGQHFGKRLPGVFTDEPHLRPAGQFHWTPDLPEVFQRRWGYDLRDHLASLSQPVGDWKRVRHNYYQTLNDLFVERWARPVFEYCEARGLDFTGHYWEHEWPNCTTVPDNMAMYAWHQRPAIDTLFNQYSEDVRAQFGNTRAVLELASVANQLDRKRTLCEAYGGAGWETRLEDMKRIGDWLYVLGVNTMNEHLSRISMRGARKADYPPSFSYHSPWWEAYHVPAAYFTRLSAALSSGRQINEILIIEPTTTAWMYQGEPADPRKALGDAFQALVVDLAQAQVEFDIGSEDIIEDHGAIEGGRFVVGERSYSAVVLPPLLENLNSPTVALLSEYVRQGGLVYACMDPNATRADGAPMNWGQKLANQPSWRSAAPDALREALHAHTAATGMAVHREANDEGILYHHRRRFDDGELLFLVNTSLTHPSRGRIAHTGKSVYRWDPETGAIIPHASGVGEIPFELPPAGSLLLEWRDGAPAADPVPEAVRGEPIAPTGATEVHRDVPNVLVLDFLDVTAGGETREKVYYHRAAEFAFQKHGLEHNPWDHAVQFKDNLVSQAFPEDSGFTATYRFTIQGAPAESLSAVVERPDLYTITCNGQPVAATPGLWWFDRSFGILDISDAVREGENTLTLEAHPFTMFHEIAATYIIGDFALEAADAGFQIVAAKPLGLAPWNQQGMPFLGCAVEYTQTYTLETPADAYRVSLPNWYGSVAEVRVNDKQAGYIWRQPWRLDLAGKMQPGANRVTVRVIGTPRNSMGPNHGDHAPGLAGPGHFRTAPDTGPPPGSEYESLAYGLFAPFEMRPLSR